MDVVVVGAERMVAECIVIGVETAAAAVAVVVVVVVEYIVVGNWARRLVEGMVVETAVVSVGCVVVENFPVLVDVVVVDVVGIVVDEIVNMVAIG